MYYTGLLQMCLERGLSLLDDFYCMYPRRPPTSPQANPCVPHTRGAWKGIPEHPWVGGGRIETNKDGLVGVFRLGTGVAAMAGGGTCEIRNLMDSLRTDYESDLACCDSNQVIVLMTEQPTQISLYFVAKTFVVRGT